MGLTVVKGSVVGDHIEGPKRWVACPRCGEYNESGASRCRDCLTSFLETSASAPAPAIISRRTPRSQNLNLDDLWTELEELTRTEELVWFQCPICSSIVDGAATHCVCGAIFEDPAERVAYACPLCDARVAADSVRCRCGARFSD